MESRFLPYVVQRKGNETKTRNNETNKIAMLNTKRIDWMGNQQQKHGCNKKIKVQALESAILYNGGMNSFIVAIISLSCVGSKLAHFAFSFHQSSISNKSSFYVFLFLFSVFVVCGSFVIFICFVQVQCKRIHK